MQRLKPANRYDVADELNNASLLKVSDEAIWPTERIGCPHRTEIRSFQICHFCITFKMFVMAYTMTVNRLMVFPCDQSIQSLLDHCATAQSRHQYM